MPGIDSARLNSYLVESYWPGVNESRVLAITRRARQAAVALSSQGTEIRYRTALLVTEDEVAFCLFDAGSAATVAEACRQAQLPFDRIKQVLQIEGATT